MRFLLLFLTCLFHSILNLPSIGAMWYPTDSSREPYKYLFIQVIGDVLPVNGDKGELNAIAPAALLQFLVMLPCLCRTGLKILVGASSFVCLAFGFGGFILKNCEHHVKKDAPKDMCKLKPQGLGWS